MPEMHLRQPRFTYSFCGPFTKNKGRIQIFKDTGDSRYIYQNKLDKASYYWTFLQSFKNLKNEKYIHLL